MICIEHTQQCERSHIFLVVNQLVASWFDNTQKWNKNKNKLKRIERRKKKTINQMNTKRIMRENGGKFNIIIYYIWMINEDEILYIIGFTILLLLIRNKKKIFFMFFKEGGEPWSNQKNKGK